MGQVLGVCAYLVAVFLAVAVFLEAVDQVLLHHAGVMQIKISEPAGFSNNTKKKIGR